MLVNVEEVDRLCAQYRPVAYPYCKAVRKFCYDIQTGDAIRSHQNQTEILQRYLKPHTLALFFQINVVKSLKAAGSERRI